ncbi:MAG: hypothetical protein WCF03_16320 [Nitrososphaeraceae archaeon]
MEQQQKHRPLGITIIAILTIIDGIAFLASGIAAVTIAPFLFGVDINNSNNNVPPVTGTSTLGSVTIPDTLLLRMSVVTGVAILTLGIAYFVMTYGLLEGKGWVWTVTVVLCCIGIALGLVSVVNRHLDGIFNILINAFIFYYIYRPYVKSFFGKATTTTAADTASLT